jgi:signal transduction histidine kinase
MTHEIGETERMKNEFISTVSHELRTPLTAIKGWGETIKFAQNDSELVNKGLDVIVTESERLSDLVEELLDFSRMESGKLSLKKANLDIVRELTEVLEVFESRSTREGIDMVVDIPYKSLMINADKNRLKQAFVNIIDNSFKYTSKGGFVKVALRVNNSSVIITINDNGCGISKHDLPKIRDKFFKANNSARGSGIGLAVTDEIIKLHNGEMNIESDIGAGTIVSVILPRINK